MAGHLSYEEGKKVVVKGLILLGIVTIAEVLVALIGKGKKCFGSDSITDLGFDSFFY